MRPLLPLTLALLLTACASGIQPDEDAGSTSSLGMRVDEMGSASSATVGGKVRGSSSGQSSVSDIVREPVSVRGRIGCLPKKGDGPHTMECAMGLLGAENNNYALDAAKLENGIFEYEGTIVEINGLLTPLAMISSAQMHTYDIVGVISIDTIERAE